MLRFEWNPVKNELLKIDRGIGFENIVAAFEEGKVLDIYAHPNQRKYPEQHMLVVEIQEYAYVIPFVYEGEKVFLKTIFPSRRATEKYISRCKKH